MQFLDGFSLHCYIFHEYWRNPTQRWGRIRWKCILLPAASFRLVSIRARVLNRRKPDLTLQIDGNLTLPCISHKGIEFLLYLTLKKCLSNVLSWASLRSAARCWAGSRVPTPPLKADSHIACRAHAAPMLFPSHSPAMPCVNSHMPCRSPALLRECRVLRESPRGSRKYPKC